MVLKNEAWMLPLHTNVETFSHASMPVDSLNCFSTSASESSSVPSASGPAWQAPSFTGFRLRRDSRSWVAEGHRPPPQNLDEALAIECDRKLKFE